MYPSSNSMSLEAKARLKAMPKASCTVCGQKGGYTTPTAKCFECKHRFCYDHINGGQTRSKMAENEEVRDICDKCQTTLNYSLV